MPTLMQPRRGALTASARTPAEIAEWGASVASTMGVVSCCECRMCQEAEALALATRLRGLARAA
jgi:hypothetical protein